MWTLVAFVALLVNVMFLGAIVIHAVSILRTQIRSQLILKTFDLDGQLRGELEPMLSTRPIWTQLTISLSLVFIGFLCTWHFFNLAGLTP